VSSKQRLENWQAFFVGLVATVFVLVVYVLGGLDWAELKTLDLRFLYANAITESDRIVCVDIDDAAIELGGRWPWHRDVQAAMLSILVECGARTLLVDITYGESEPWRLILPPNAGITRDPRDLVGDNIHITCPDDEIAQTIRRSGQVYLAFDYAARDAAAGVSWDTFLDSSDFASLVAALERQRPEEAAWMAERFPPRVLKRGSPPWEPLDWAKLVALLTDRPLLGEEEAAAAVALRAPRWLPAILESCRDAALRRRVRRWMDTHPERAGGPVHVVYEHLFAEVLGGAARHEQQLHSALQAVLSYDATTAAPFVQVARVEPIAQEVDAISPVFFRHARAARRCGFVVFEPDLDGIMRRTRLMVQHRRQVLPQLAFAVAVDTLGLQVHEVDTTRGRISFDRADAKAPLVVQVDSQGRVLTPWVAQRDWTLQFGDHVPMGVVWEVHNRRGNVQHNRAQAARTLERLHADGQLDLGEQATFADDLAQRVQLDRRLQEAICLRDETGVAHFQSMITQYETLLSEGESGVLASVNRALADTATPSASSPTDAHTRQTRLRALQRVLNANREHQDVIRKNFKWLRQRVSGKIALVGYTATSLADMTPIPTHRRAPGVVAHANLLSGLLTGQTVTWAPAALNVSMAGLLGIIASLVSVRWGPRTAAAVALFALAYVGLAGWLAFYVWQHWIALTPAVGTLATSYVAVLAYRYLFLERQRRHLTRALGQYTSATLARQMAENPALCERAETREVTAMFTDLAGFTRLSERIGAERTQRVLNVSLGQFSDVMLRHEGMVNKFIGDGIFAFWNPVIYPQPDHARRACITAVELMIALREMAKTQQAAGGDAVFGELVLRIGVATGNAVVGPCGSEQKYDYTCIGDSVNVAARLESANKFFGTRILVSETTLAQAGDGFATRYLGAVQVKGKTQGVGVRELLGWAKDISTDTRAYAERFAAAVTLFRQRQWKDALEAFDACSNERPDDLAAQQYLDVIPGHLVHPPDDDWPGALTLSEK
jgi:class 3 adenylate cyclase/CHASE2 domain-containing sensor protein